MSEEQPNWREIAFALAKFARHTKDCCKHPFDRDETKCHCGYQQAFNEFKKHEAKHYLSTIKKAA